MAAYLALAVLVSLLAAAAASGDYSVSSSYPKGGGGKKLVVKVEGLVYCQSCAHRNSWRLLDGDKPLPGAKVTVTCRDRKNRVMAWRTAVADRNGYYVADFGYGPPAAAYYGGHPTKACFVRLLSSPSRKCDGLTTINHGIQGAPIRDEGRSPATGEYVLYAPGHLAFRPRRCAPTHHY